MLLYNFLTGRICYYNLKLSQLLYFIVVTQQPGRDLVFLLDGSDGTRTGFPAMRDFVQRIVETLSVDDKKDRVSVVQYSRDASVQFYLNTYMTKGEILDAVRGLRHKGGRPLNTGAALQYVRDNVFTASAGSRQPEGVPQVLVLLSGGRSYDSVDAPVAALKQMGVLIFAIGSRGSDRGELQKVSHEPSYALSVSEFTDLPSVQQQLQASVEAVVIDVTPELPTVLGMLSSMFSFRGPWFIFSHFNTRRDGKEVGYVFTSQCVFHEKMYSIQQLCKR